MHEIRTKAVVIWAALWNGKIFECHSRCLIKRLPHRVAIGKHKMSMNETEGKTVDWKILLPSRQWISPYHVNSTTSICKHVRIDSEKKEPFTSFLYKRFRLFAFCIPPPPSLPTLLISPLFTPVSVNCVRGCCGRLVGSTNTGIDSQSRHVRGNSRVS